MAKETPTKLNRHVGAKPASKVKREVDVVEQVSCLLCGKGFASEIAINNHARIQHIDVYNQGDPSLWTYYKLFKPAEKEQKKIEEKTNKLLLSMTPTNLCDLASKEVSYVLMKTEDSVPGSNNISNPESQNPKEKPMRIPNKKNVLSVNGHFQCVYSSKTVDSVCDQIFPSCCEYSMHYYGEHVRRKGQHCRLCEKSIIPESDDLEHSETEEGVHDPVKKKSKSKRSREKSEKMQKKEKDLPPINGPFECLEPSEYGNIGLCRQIFFSCCRYSIHYRDEHKRRKGRKGLRCQVCEKLLTSGPDEPEPPYTCEVCGETHNSEKELTEHRNLKHVKLRPFKCGICYKRFTQSGGLQQHMRMHTGDRPYPCTLCPKRFSQRSGLGLHLRTHTKEKPYRCVVCHKSFCQHSHLKQHMRIHTNVTPFQCSICSKKFKQGSHLSNHLRTHSATMTEDQKANCAQLLGVIDNEREIVEIEINESEADLIEQMEAVKTEETEYGEHEIVSREDFVEQVIAVKTVEAEQDENQSSYVQENIEMEINRDVSYDHIEYIEEIEEVEQEEECYFISENDANVTLEKENGECFIIVEQG